MHKNPLPVNEIFTQSLLLPIRRLPDLLKYILPLVIVLGVISLLARNESYQNASPQQIYLYIFIALPIFFIALSIMEVGCYRKFLNAENITLKREIIIVLKYISALILLILSQVLLYWGFLFVLAVIIFGYENVSYIIKYDMEGLQALMKKGHIASGSLGSFITMFFLGSLLIVYINLKFLFILPMVAMSNKKISLSYIWNLSKNNNWRLIGLIIFSPMLIYFIINIILSLFSVSISNHLLLATLSIILLLYILIMKVALLALSYKHFLEKNLATTTEPIDVMTNN